jgi:phosphohistidine swiveling domain-containing protein
MANNDNLAELLKTQKSLTEWLEDIKHKDAEAIRQEDNDKRERLKKLNQLIGLPFDEPTQFEATDLVNRSPAFIKYLSVHGDELCALRLIPKVAGLPKLRMRGKTISDAYTWFLEQDIEYDNYRSDFIPHVDNTLWATIFIVNKHGIQGEITHAGHHELTQGFHKKDKPIVFRYDFKGWKTTSDDKAVVEYLKKLTKYLYVPDKKMQITLADELGVTFSNNYINGYFETTESKEFGTWFIDYSPGLGNMYSETIIRTTTGQDGLVNGMTGSTGIATGKVVIVDPKNIDGNFPKRSVLVCPVTTPDYVPLMQKAVAIVTDQGGILSHAAIVARELKKPCIVATENATKVLTNGQLVTVDADAGVVKPA